VVTVLQAVSVKWLFVARSDEATVAHGLQENLLGYLREPYGRRFLPATGNASELRIGHNIKERYRTKRGYKRTASLRRVPAITAYLREANDPQALATFLAG
jgi:hypothetical protein